MRKEEIIKFYQTYRLYIFPTIVALSSIFLIVFAIYPQIMKMITNQKNVNDLTIKSKLLETKVTALEGLDTEDLAQKVGIAIVSLPAEKDYGGALDLLQQLVITSGFRISSISLSNSVNKLGNTDGLEVKLDVKGVRNMFQTLLDNIDNSPRLVRINNFDVSSISSQQLIDASLTVEVLFVRLPQSQASTDAPLLELNQKDKELLTNLARNNNISSTSGGEVSTVRGKVNPFE